MRAAAAWLLALLASPVQADWEWTAPVTVGPARGPAFFPHLESANRRGVAVSADMVGVAWEDSRDGTPHCYLAVKPLAAPAFEAETRLSASECYTPVLIAAERGRFLAAWEEGGRVYARVLPDGERIALSATDAGQVTLASRADRTYAAWAEQAGRFRRIVVARLEVKGKTVKVTTAKPVEAGRPANEQGWPALAVRDGGGVTVAWEDRRYRHTVPMVSHSRDGGSFSPPVRLTDRKSGAVNGLGAGTGAMRPSLTNWRRNRVVAVWLDKRDFLSGYDVYAAFDSGTRRFGRNVQVQDGFGDNMAQWHAQIAGDDAGRLLAVWDDARDGTPDVWLAEWNGESFGDNVAVPGASGPGAQSDPIATLDAQGRLHVVWLDQDAAGSARIRYASAAPR
ncbi:MAG: hypothetical protein ACYC5S_03575 [Thiobacillus sp.]